MILTVLLAAAAIGFWVSFVVHTVWLVKHRRPDVSVSRLAFNGYLFFNPDTFVPSGHAVHRRFGLSILGALLSGALLIAWSAIR